MVSCTMGSLEGCIDGVAAAGFAFRQIKAQVMTPVIRLFDNFGIKNRFNQLFMKIRPPFAAKGTTAGHQDFKRIELSGMHETGKQRSPQIIAGAKMHGFFGNDITGNCAGMQK